MCTLDIVKLFHGLYSTNYHECVYELMLVTTMATVQAIQRGKHNTVIIPDVTNAGR